MEEQDNMAVDKQTLREQDPQPNLTANSTERRLTAAPVHEASSLSPKRAYTDSPADPASATEIDAYKRSRVSPTKKTEPKDTLSDVPKAGSTSISTIHDQESMHAAMTDDAGVSDNEIFEEIDPAVNGMDVSDAPIKDEAHEKEGSNVSMTMDAQKGDTQHESEDSDSASDNDSVSSNEMAESPATTASSEEDEQGQADEMHSDNEARVDQGLPASETVNGHDNQDEYLPTPAGSDDSLVDASERQNAAVSQPPLDMSDRVRGPNSSKLFFTRESYEAYSVQSMDHIVDDIIRFIQKDPLPVETPAPAASKLANILAGTDKERSGQRGPNDLDIAAMAAAEPDTPSAAKPELPAVRPPVEPSKPIKAAESEPTTSAASKLESAKPEVAKPEAARAKPAKSIPRPHVSRFNRQEHVRFLRISEALRQNPSQVSEMDRAFYNKMHPEVLAEKNDFLREQQRMMQASGVYDILDPELEKRIEEYYSMENKRMHCYPQFYKKRNTLDLRIKEMAHDGAILQFKKGLKRQGKIARCRIKDISLPCKFDLSKNYIQTSSTSSVSYYQKKLPCVVSDDPSIASLLTDEEQPHIVVSMDAMLALTELKNNPTMELMLPIVVKPARDGQEKIVYFDRPAPRGALSARERNQLIYEMTFKSLCLDWKNKQRIRNSATTTATTEDATSQSSSMTAAETSSTDGVAWSPDEDENLIYNMWSFGPLNILIRHQADAYYLSDTPSGAEHRRICLSAKLDYQIAHHVDESITATERAHNWLRSYIAGHAMIMEGRIDVPNQTLVRVDKRHMRDIMGDKWQPIHESQLIRHIFTQAQDMLQPGIYMLQYNHSENCFTIYEAMTQTQDTADFDLYKACCQKPSIASSKGSYVPGWAGDRDHVPWIFPPAPA